MSGTKRPYWTKDCTEKLEKLVQEGKDYKEIAEVFKDYWPQTFKKKYHDATSPQTMEQVQELIDEFNVSESPNSVELPNPQHQPVQNQVQQYQPTHAAPNLFCHPIRGNPKLISSSNPPSTIIMPTMVEDIPSHTESYAEDSILGVGWFVSYDIGFLCLYIQKFQTGETVRVVREDSHTVKVHVTYQISDQRLDELGEIAPEIPKSAFRHHLVRTEKKMTIHLVNLEISEKSSIKKIADSNSSLMTFPLLKTTEEKMTFDL